MAEIAFPLSGCFGMKHLLKSNSKLKINYMWHRGVWFWNERDEFSVLFKSFNWVFCKKILLGVHGYKAVPEHLPVLHSFLYTG